MNDIKPAEVISAEYEILLTGIVEAFRGAERDNLRRYHRIGNWFHTFLNNMGTPKYGAATVEGLARDLQSQGVLTTVSVEAATRTLYFTRHLFETYTDHDKLEQLAEIGFSMSHAKLLFPLDESTREKVESQMIRDQRVVSTRALSEIIETATRQKLQSTGATAAEAAKQAKEFREQVTKQDPLPQEPELPAAAPAEAATGEKNPAGEAEKKAKEPSTKPEGAKTNTIKERTVANPKKVVKKMTDALTKIQEQLPDVFIAIRETQQQGFDNDSANKKWMDELRTLLQATRQTVEPLNELVKTIADEDQASHIPTGDK